MSKTQKTQFSLEWTFKNFAFEQQLNPFVQQKIRFNLFTIILLIYRTKILKMNNKAYKKWTKTSNVLFIQITNELQLRDKEAFSYNV